MNKHADYKTSEWRQRTTYAADERPECERLKWFADPERMRKQSEDPRVERIMLPCDKEELAKPPAWVMLYDGISEENLKLAWIRWKHVRAAALYTGNNIGWPQWLAEHKAQYV